MRVGCAAAIGLLVILATACSGGSASPTPTLPPPSSTSPSFNATTPAGLEPAVSEFPAAGVCEPGAADVVTFMLESDVPRPRCGQVRPDQHLRFVNETAATVEVHLAQYDLTIEPGDAKDIDAPVGSYLAPGVHVVKSRLYAGTGPEIVVLQK